MTAQNAPITGTAAGVPFVAHPPSAGPRSDAPVVIAWHPLDPPRSETALAAALPLKELDAWRVYLGLPQNGSRLPAGGWDALIESVGDEPVLRLHGPVTAQALAEFRPALAELRDRLQLGDGPLGLLGGSLGGAVALSVLAEPDIEVAATVLVNPLLQLRTLVEVYAPMQGLSYEWSAEGEEIASRLDFVARAKELDGTPLLLVLGADDLKEAFHVPATRLHEALPASELVMIPDMGHGFADEPGLDPAPQTPEAAIVERYAVDWFQRHLR